MPMSIFPCKAVQDAIHEHDEGKARSQHEQPDGFAQGAGRGVAMLMLMQVLFLLACPVEISFGFSLHDQK